MNDSVYSIILSGRSDNNIKYSDFQNLIVDLGFEYQRQEGSHRIYRHPIYRISMNIQSDGSKAKGYQVKQLRTFIIKYKIGNCETKRKIVKKAEYKESGRSN